MWWEEAGLFLGAGGCFVGSLLSRVYGAGIKSHTLIETIVFVNASLYLTEMYFSYSSSLACFILASSLLKTATCSS